MTARLGIAIGASLLCLLVLDQVLARTFLTRPVSSLRGLIEITGSSEPPFYRLRPGLSTTWTRFRDRDATQVRTSSLGFRGPDRPEAKTPGTLRVVLMGDSVTFGLGVDDPETLPVKLEAALGRPDVEVWNGAVPGYAMADYVNQLPASILRLAPDLILFQLNRNDSRVPMPLSPRLMAAMDWSGLARAWLILRFNYLYDHAAYVEALRRFLERARAAGVPVIVWTVGVPDDRDDELLAIATACNAKVVDVHAETLERLEGDPLHFSPTGNAEAARRLLPVVETRLGAARK